MDKTGGKIGIIQIIMIIMLFNGLLSHVIVNPILLDASHRDSWITLLFTGVLYIPWTILIVYIMRKSERQHLQEWLAKKTSSFLSWVMLAPVAVLLLIIGNMTITQTTVWTVSNYLPTTPQTVIIIILIIVCHYAAKHGITAIAIGSGIILPAVIVLGYFVSIANMREKEWLLLLPVFENGWMPIFNGMMYAGGALSEIFLVLLLQHRLKTTIKPWQIMLLGLLLVYISLGPIIGAITEFGPTESAKQMVSPYEQWRLVKLGNYLEHVDFLSVFQWLSGATIRISLAQFLIAELFAPRNTKLRNRIITLITTIYIILAVGLKRYNTFYLGLFKLVLIATLIIAVVLTAIWAVIAWFAKPTKEETS
ncbi:endospore germination permease [Paenibacillus lutimineralis]|uniref:Spore gernimation protein n=1 Tax=Paenibacillus lutimineralis TaxID=2707005 RepID=A0A3S9UYD3_9BACL|nr:endospore germination permease [Paenibacillus lutimineralis]AZS15310.1 spore gernimation protein [Paenibacillus lutimineralis]